MCLVSLQYQRLCAVLAIVYVHKKIKKKKKTNKFYYIYTYVFIYLYLKGNFILGEGGGSQSSLSIKELAVAIGTLCKADGS